MGRLKSGIRRNQLHDVRREHAHSSTTHMMGHGASNDNVTSGAPCQPYLDLIVCKMRRKEGCKIFLLSTRSVWTLLEKIDLSSIPGCRRRTQQ